MNVLCITGNVCNDIACRKVKTKNGDMSVCDLRVAENSYRNGEKITNFFKVTVWGTTAENCQKYLAKGSAVNVTGEVGVETYEKKDGTNGFSLVIYNPRVEFGPKSQVKTDDPEVVAKIPTNKNEEVVEVSDDDLPF